MDNKLASYIESSLPKGTGIVGPPHNETASAPATAIMSAHDTNNGKKISKHDGRHQNIPIKFKPLNSGIFRNKNLVLLHPLQSLLSLKSKKQCKYTGYQLVRDCMKVNHFHVHIQEIQNN